MKTQFTLITLLSALLLNPAWSDNGSGGSGDPQPVPHYVEHLVNTGEYAKASKKLRYFVRKERESFNGWSLLAISQFKIGKLKASLKSHKKALKLERNDIAINRSLGELYLAMGNTSKANNQLQKLQQLCGNCDDYVQLEDVIATAQNS